MKQMKCLLGEINRNAYITSANMLFRVLSKGV